MCKYLMWGIDMKTAMNVIYVTGNALEMEKFHCTCGNTCDDQGFYPCDNHGIYLDEYDGSEFLYRCDSCNRLYVFDCVKVPYLRMFMNNGHVGTFQEFYDANMDDDDVLIWLQECEIGDVLGSGTDSNIVRVKDRK